MTDADTTMVGNITRDPELRFTASGMATAKFGLAVNYRRRNPQTQEWDETTSFVDVVCFQQMAENAAESLQKGARIIVKGRLQVRDWEGQDGKKGRSVEVVADEIGPSLRWATASVTRSDRRGPSEGAAPAADSDRQGPPERDFSSDEEPF